jgi:hypothetical protein
MDDGLPHLRAQLAASTNIGVVLRNGRQVIDQVLATGLADLREVGVLRGGQGPCRLYAANIDVDHGGPAWLAWSANLQSGRGISTALKQDLADWLKSTYRSGHPAGPGGTDPSPTPTPSAAPVSASGIEYPRAGSTWRESVSWWLCSPAG